GRDLDLELTSDGIEHRLHRDRRSERDLLDGAGEPRCDGKVLLSAALEGRVRAVGGDDGRLLADLRPTVMRRDVEARKRLIDDVGHGDARLRDEVVTDVALDDLAADATGPRDADL